MSTKERFRSYDLALMSSTFNDIPNTWTPFTRHSNSKSGALTEQRSTNPDSLLNWRQLIAQHSSATTSLSATRYDLRNFNSHGSLEWSGVRISNGDQVEGVRLKGCLCPSLAALTNPGLVADLTHVNVRALAGFAKQIVRAQTALQSLVCFGEFGETARSIRRPLKSLYEGVFDYLKKAERAARKAKRVHRLSNPGATMSSPSMRRDVSKALAGAWLESVFGWLPLISDIEGAIKAMSRIAIARPPTEFVRYKDRDSVFGNRIKSTVSYGGGVSLTTYAARYVSLDVKMYGTLINRNGWDGAVDDLGFGWRQWVPTLWELIPYSFLVDYFTNIGDIISALAINRALVAWINIGTKRSETTSVISIDPIFLASSPLIKRSGSMSPGYLPSSAKVTVQRSPYTGSLVPPLAYEIPGLGMRWLNITALVGQALASSSRIRS